MKWNVSFYSEGVEKSVMDMPAGVVAHFLRLADLMVEFGPNLGMPHTRSMGDGPFELRLRGREGIARVFYCKGAGRNIVMLHAYVKKTEQTPLRELRIAKARLKETTRS